MYWILWGVEIAIGADFCYGLKCPVSRFPEVLTFGGNLCHVVGPEQINIQYS